MEWLRWYHGAVSDPKWPLIARKAGVSVGVVVSVWAALLEHASQDEERGSISGFDGETFDALYGYDDGTCGNVVNAMLEKGLICDGCICSWRKRQPLREDFTATERKRQQRSREKDDMSRNVTHGSRNVTQGSHNVTTEQNREEKIREELNTPPLPPEGEDGVCVETSPVPDIAFEQIWEAYPEISRVDKQDAWKAYKSEAKRHGMAFIGPMRILDAIAAYAASPGWQEDGGRYIPHLKKFLSSGRYLEPPPPQRPKVNPTRDGPQVIPQASPQEVARRKETDRAVLEKIEAEATRRALARKVVNG